MLLIIFIKIITIMKISILIKTQKLVSVSKIFRLVISISKEVILSYIFIFVTLLRFKKRKILYKF